MPAVTIIGAGVFGLSVAHALPLSYDVTIVARDLPGDADSLGWASPWAGAVFDPGSTQDRDEIEILKASFRSLWEIAERHPASSVKKIPTVLFRDATDTDADLWWRNWIPEYRIMDPTELPPDSGAKIAISHAGLILNPPKYICWLRDRLEARGVRFIHRTIRTLSDVYTVKDQDGMMPDVVVNATGVGARSLGGVEDPEVHPVRGQTMLIADPNMMFKQVILRIGTDYSYVIPRLDGTVVLGGVREPDDPCCSAKPELRDDICARTHELNPLVPATSAGVTIIKDIVGFRPGRTSGLRVDSEIIDDIPVVHAYGAGGVGFTLSAGVGRRAAKLVDELLQRQRGQ